MGYMTLRMTRPEQHLTYLHDNLHSEYGGKYVIKVIQHLENIARRNSRAALFKHWNIFLAAALFYLVVLGASRTSQRLQIKAICKARFPRAFKCTTLKTRSGLAGQNLAWNMQALRPKFSLEYAGVFIAQILTWAPLSY